MRYFDCFTLPNFGTGKRPMGSRIWKQNLWSVLDFVNDDGELGHCDILHGKCNAKVKPSYWVNPEKGR